MLSKMRVTNKRKLFCKKKIGKFNNQPMLLSLSVLGFVPTDETCGSVKHAYKESECCESPKDTPVTFVDETLRILVGDEDLMD